MKCKRPGCDHKAKKVYCSDYCRRKDWRDTHPIETKHQRKRQTKQGSTWAERRQIIIDRYGVGKRATSCHQ